MGPSLSSSRHCGTVSLANVDSKIGCVASAVEDLLHGGWCRRRDGSGRLVGTEIVSRMIFRADDKKGITEHVCARSGRGIAILYEDIFFSLRVVVVLSRHSRSLRTVHVIQQTRWGYIPGM